MFSLHSLIIRFISLILGISPTQSFPPPLSAKEETELFKKMRDGDNSARARIIEHNLRLVSHIIRKYYASYEYPDELLSIGNVGLIKAVDSFKPCFGTRFATYGAKCVQNEILMFFRSKKKRNMEVSINDTIDVDKDGNPLTYLDIISVEEPIDAELDLKVHINKIRELVDTEYKDVYQQEFQNANVVLDTMQDTLLGLRFELSPQSFFQVNPEQTEILYTKALEAAMPNGSLDHRILDVYCGAGTITLAAAERASFAVGVELVPPAIENARRNAKMNGLEKKTRFICGDAAREIPRLIASGERFGAAIIDPPRKGADERVLGAMAHAGLPRIAYVSCNPSTLARDVKFLAAQGYRLEWAQPVDMFPWTEHVETAASLVLKKG